ncbi:MAG: hypothetical protein NZ518_00885 [Dehalococcoidia bacterium]|nr:hypothetical protein [Dehalococcoidia bacterium]
MANTPEGSLRRAPRSLRVMLVAVALLLMAPGSTSIPEAFGFGRDDFPVQNGWFFSQANGRGGGGEVGFSVTNNEGIPFWTWWGRLGGLEVVGYPISDRFIWNGFVSQAFQKAVLQWRPETQTVVFVNVFDELAAAGHDQWLLDRRQTPPSQDWSIDTGQPWERVVANHVALLDRNPAIRQAYFSVPDPVTQFGLPMATLDLPNVFVVRAQRVVFQQWKVSVPWAAAGQVVVANGGDIAKEVGMFPAEAVLPRPPGSFAPMTSVTSAQARTGQPTPGAAQAAAPPATPTPSAPVQAVSNPVTGAPPQPTLRPAQPTPLTATPAPAATATPQPTASPPPPVPTQPIPPSVLNPAPSGPGVIQTAGQPWPSTPPSVRSSIVGYWHKPIANDVFLQRMAEGGGLWVRSFLKWEVVEPVRTDPPTYNWAWYDAELNLLRARGLQPMINIVDPPTWAAFPTCGPFRDADAQARFARFAAAAVQRYSQAPFNAAIFILYNEPDFRISNPNDKNGGGWGGGCWGNDPIAYANMLRVVYPAMKQANPAVQVSVGALAADGCDPDFNCNFLRDVMDPARGNAANLFDLVAFNYFSFYRRNWEANGFSLLGKAEGLRQITRQFGVNRPLIVAETGMNVEGESGKTAEDGAIYVPQALTMALRDNARPDGVQIVTWFTLRDSDDPNDRWGLVTPQGAPKASFPAFQTWVREMANARFLRDESQPTFQRADPPPPGARRCNPGDPFICDALIRFVFSVPEGERHVLWIDHGAMRGGQFTKTLATRVVELPADRILAIRDRNGQLVQYRVDGSRAFVTVSESAIYVTLRP